jgi:hypothetical protein
MQGTAHSPSFSPSYRWTSLVGAGLHARVAGRIRRLSDTRHWQENAAGIQLAQLRNLLRTASGTVFGKEREFARIAALDDGEMLAAYRKSVPITDA